MGRWEGGEPLSYKVRNSSVVILIINFTILKRDDYSILRYDINKINICK